jgi:hypothetical protein
MKLTSRDFHSLRQAADVADAQSELIELMKRQTQNPPDGQNWQSDAGVIAAALALIFGITLAAVTHDLDSETLAYRAQSP